MINNEEMTNKENYEYNKTRFNSLSNILRNFTDNEVLNNIHTKISLEVSPDMLFDNFVESLVADEKLALLEVTDNILNNNFSISIERSLQNHLTLLDVVWVLREQYSVPAQSE